MWPRSAGELCEGPCAPEDDPDWEEPVSSHFNTNNFGNFLEAWPLLFWAPSSSHHYASTLHDCATIVSCMSGGQHSCMPSMVEALTCLA